MTVGIQKRDRCRLCYSLILRDRSALFSSICCQKYYHVFKPIQRTKIPRKNPFPYQMKISNRTVCFRDLIIRYLRTDIQSKKYFSNFICYDCSKILLDIEQCAKYLTKTINQLKRKFNKSNRLFTSSLSATFQKKQPIIKHEQLPIVNSDDDDEEFDDLDDDEEKSDDEVDDTKARVSMNTTTPPKSRHFTSPSSASGSLSNLPRIHLINQTNNNNGDCSDDEDNDDEEEDDEEEKGLITKSQSTKQKNPPEFSQKNNAATLTNVSDPSMHLIDGMDPNNFQIRLAHMMANIAAASSPSPHHNMDSMMSSFANMQRNLLKIFTNPMAAAQATATTQIKSNISPVSSHNKQIGSGRKRKSTPEKRVITNHRSTNNNGNTSPTLEHESMNNSTEDINDHPLELTVKDSQRSNRTVHPKEENGSSSYQHIDEDHKETTTPNDSSLSLSPSLNRRSTTTKRARLSTIGQYDYTNTNNLSMVNLPPSTTDLLSPNHHQTVINDDNHQRQQRKLDPRSCAECGKVLFSDKTHLLHCQTHAKNEKQCWICGRNDDDIKKHILNEHGNQKFTNTGFKCQHCDKVFPDFSDLQTHTKEHSKKKPFECPICHKRFGQQGNLSCHLRIHSGVKPFTCTSCGKAFRHSNSLRRHARTVHSASRGLTPTPSSLLLPTTTTSLSNEFKNEPFDDVPSGLLIPSDDGSSSTGGIPSPSISNTQVDSD